MATVRQRAVSIATVWKSGRLFVPVVSHLFGDTWPLSGHATDAEARAYVEAIWPGIA